MGDVAGACSAALEERLEFRCYLTGLLRLEEVTACVEINQCRGRPGSGERRGIGIATPSSRRRVDGVEDDDVIQHERVVKF